MNESLGERVARYRRMEGISAEQLAARAGLTRAVIANVESGRKSDLPSNQLVALALAMDVPLAALLFDLRDPTVEIYAPNGEPMTEIGRGELLEWIVGAGRDNWGGAAGRHARAHLSAVRSIESLREQQKDLDQEITSAQSTGTATEGLIARWQAVDAAIRSQQSLLKFLGAGEGGVADGVS